MRSVSGSSQAATASTSRELPAEPDRLPHPPYEGSQSAVLSGPGQPPERQQQEAQRLVRAATKISQDQIAEEQRRALVADAVRSYWAISDALFEAGEAAASIATA